MSALYSIVHFIGDKINGIKNVDVVPTSWIELGQDKKGSLPVHQFCDYIGQQQATATSQKLRKTM